MRVAPIRGAHHEFAAEWNRVSYPLQNFSQFDFDFGPGVQQRTATGPLYSVNTFLLKLDSKAGFQWLRAYDSTSPSAVNVSPDGKTVLVGGAFGGTVDLDPSAGEDLHTAQGVTDAYTIAFNSDGEKLWSMTRNTKRARDFRSTRD